MTLYHFLHVVTRVFEIVTLFELLDFSHTICVLLWAQTKHTFFPVCYYTSPYSQN